MFEAIVTLAATGSPIVPVAATATGVAGVGAGARAMQQRAVQISTNNTLTQAIALAAAHGFDIAREVGKEGGELLDRAQAKLDELAASRSSSRVSPWTASVTKKAQANVRAALEARGVQPTHAATLAAAGHTLAREAPNK